MKNKTTAALLALCLGAIGVHKFYLGEGGKGFMYFLLGFTGISVLLGIIDSLSLFTMDQRRFDAMYNYGYLPQSQDRFQDRQVSRS